MDIAYVSPTWPCSHAANGIVTYTATMAPALRQLGNNVKVYACSGAPGDQCSPGGTATVLDLPAFRRRILNRALYRLGQGLVANNRVKASAIALAVAEAASRPDLIEMEESFGATRELKQGINLPLVTRLHGPWCLVGSRHTGDMTAEDRWRIRREGQGIYDFSDGVTAPCQMVIDAISDFYGRALPHARVVPNAVAEPAAEMMWQESDEEPYILYVGRFDHVKGADILLQAFVAMAHEVPAVKLLFVGPDKGIERQGRQLDFHQYLTQLPGGSAVAGRIEFLGRIPPSRVAELRRNAKLSVVASRYETFPLTLLESLAVGCPTVATAVGGIPEVIGASNCAEMVPGEDPEALAAAMLALLGDNTRRTELSQRAITQVRDNFYPQPCAEQMLDFYQTLA